MKKPGEFVYSPKYICLTLALPFLICIGFWLIITFIFGSTLEWLAWMFFLTGCSWVGIFLFYFFYNEKSILDYFLHKIKKDVTGIKRLEPGEETASLDKIDTKVKPGNDGNMKMVHEIEPKHFSFKYVFFTAILPFITTLYLWLILPVVFGSEIEGLAWLILAIGGSWLWLCVFLFSRTTGALRTKKHDKDNPEKIS
ncbi:MAG: hypothetical protein Q6365_012585 [Candidatus Sigynarchaeota archaeon]